MKKIKLIFGAILATTLLFLVGQAKAGGDLTPPTITSIIRYNPMEQDTSATSAVLRITFSEDVENVNEDDFVLSGTAASAIAQLGSGVTISQVSPSVYDCTIPETFNGTFYLSISGSQNIQDINGNPYVLEGSNGIAGTNEQYNFIRKVATPTALPAGGTYSSTKSVTLSSAAQGNTIYYTIDGSIPTTSSAIYLAPIAVSHNTNLKAIAITPGDLGLADSDIMSENYIIKHHKKKKSNPKRVLKNSPSKVKWGQVIVQSGKKFSKNNAVNCEFSKPGGGYYAPLRINTDASGKFSTSYKIPWNKPAGAYKWKCLDLKTGKMSKVQKYTVR